MPELPEVESLRLSLEPFLVGKVIKKVQINNPKLVSSNSSVRKINLHKSDEFIKELTNEKIKQISRRAKNLILETMSGKIILIHLKMTGQLVYQDKTSRASGGHPIHNLSLPNKHTHVIFTLNHGTLYYNDTRQFGYLLYFKNQQELDKINHFKNIGLEPFSSEFTHTYLFKKLKNKNSKLKTVLLNQSVVTGLGNIYCDEVCFASQVLPNRKTNSITKEESRKLYKNITRILQHAISLGGSSISNYLLADGSRGNYAREHKVYGRSGQTCFVCKTVLSTSKFASRTTVYCKICQK